MARKHGHFSILLKVENIVSFCPKLLSFYSLTDLVRTRPSLLHRLNKPRHSLKLHVTSTLIMKPASVCIQMSRCALNVYQHVVAQFLCSQCSWVFQTALCVSPFKCSTKLYRIYRNSLKENTNFGGFSIHYCIRILEGISLK